MYEHELSEKVSNDGTRTFSPDGHGSDKELKVGHLEPAEATCSCDVPVIVTDQQGSDSSDCECCNSTRTEPYQPQSDTHIKTKQNWSFQKAITLDCCSRKGTWNQCGVYTLGHVPKQLQSVVHPPPPFNRFLSITILSPLG